MKKEDVRQSAEFGKLLEYYRERVDELQKEREEWFERLEKLRISQEDFHRVEWELKKRNEEIFDLQRSLSESQVALFEEREQVLALKREMVDYRLAAVEDRKRILQLVTLGAKEDENQFYFNNKQGLSAGASLLYPKLLPVPTNAESLAIPRTGKLNKQKEPSGLLEGKVSKKHRKHRRVVDIKEEYVKDLFAEIEKLKALNEEQRRLFEKELTELKASRLTREEQVHLDILSLNGKIAELLDRAQKLELGKIDITKDYLDARAQGQTNERGLQEENAGLRLEIKDLRDTLHNVMAKSENDIKQTATESEKRADEVLSKYRSQAQMQSENIMIIQEQYKRIQEMYLAKIKALEERLEKTTQKYKELRTRRNLEVEGFRTDVEQIRRKTRIYDEYLHRVKKLIDTNPSHALDMAKSQGLDVQPVKEQLDKLDQEIGLAKSGSIAHANAVPVA